MKKLLVGLFIFVALTTGLKAQALTLSEALSQITNLKNEILQLRSQLKGSALDPSLPSVTTSVNSYDWASVNISFNITSPTDLTSYGYCIKKGSETYSCSAIRGFTSTDNKSLVIASLNPTTTYTYYVYATNAAGKSVTPEITFTTKAVPLDAETVTGPVYGAPKVAIYWDASEITSTSATNWSYLTSDGYPLVTAADRGICYGTSPSPTFCVNSGTPKTSSGDPFYTKMTGLQPDTLYYYRAYAKNLVGIAYSADRTFRTLPGTVTTPVNGMWSTWLNSGECVNGLQTQVRTCTPPTNGGSDCVGSSTQQISCSVKVDGGWTDWYKRGTCINGVQVMARDCTNPTPAAGGAYCPGSSVQSVSCSTDTNLPNLWASRASNIAVSATPTFAVQYPITFKGTVTNGSATPTTKSFYSHFEIKNNLGGSVINLSPVASGILSANGESEVISSITIAASGSYSIRLCADQSSSTNTMGVITETDELDNCGDWAKFNVAESILAAVNTVPVLSSPTAENVTSSGAILSATITDNGVPSTIISRGVCYGVVEVPLPPTATSLVGCVESPNSQGRVFVSGLSSGKKFYFRGYAKNSFGTGYSSNGSFTTSSSNGSSVTVTAPNGGETYQQGQQITVKWNSSGIVGNIAEINLVSTQDQYGGTTLVKDIANSGQYSLILPDTSYFTNNKLDFGKNFKIEIVAGSSANNNVVSDLSDGLFTIKASITEDGCLSGQIYSSTTGQKCPVSTTPSVTVLSPNGGEIYNVNNNLSIRWKYNGVATPNDAVKIFLKDKKNNFIYTMCESCENSGLAEIKPLSSWNLVLGQRYTVSVRITDSTGFVTQDESDNLFTINSSSGLCPTDVPSVSCPEYQTEAVKDSNGCIVAFRCKNSTGCSNGEIYNTMTGALCSQINSGTQPQSSNLAPITRTLRRGVYGEDVKKLQEYLQINSDGIFGRGTAAKVKEWQLKNGLTADGLFGRASRMKAGL